jgi:tRNA-specific 2-thiouridylase
MGTNTLWIVRGHEHPWLLSNEVFVEQSSWIAGRPPTDLARPLTAKTRYRQADEACAIATDGDRCTLAFDRPQRAVTPGQSAVVYDGEVCLGGGVIASTTPVASTIVAG